MQRDLKTGMAVGLMLVIGAALWLSTRQSLSVKSRMLHLNNPAFQKSIIAEPLSSETETPAVSYDEPKSPQLAISEKTENITSQRFHIVSEGETLSAISQQYYGSANKWHKILEANSGILSDVNKLRPGLRLIIPP